MKSDSFAGFHPAVNLCFFAAAIGMSMFLMHPVFLAISIFCSCGYLWYLQGGMGLLRQVGYLLPVLLFTAVLNPLFNHEGKTVLFYLWNDNPVTLEAVCFGLASAVLMGASIVWFNCCNAVFTTDKIIYLFGRVIPSLSLLISMTLRFVPRFKDYLRSQRGCHQLHRPRLSRFLWAYHPALPDPQGQCAGYRGEGSGRGDPGHRSGAPSHVHHRRV